MSPRPLCAVEGCDKQTLSRGRLCRMHDDLRRLEKLGPCRRCGLKPVWANGMCSSCQRRDHRNKALERSYQGSPARRNDFLTLTWGIIEQLRRNISDYTHYLDTGIGSRSERVITSIMLMTLVYQLPYEQQHYIIVKVNEVVPEGGRRIPLPERSEESPMPRAVPATAPPAASRQVACGRCGATHRTLKKIGGNMYICLAGCNTNGKTSKGQAGTKGATT
jgi:hypothetical protein